MRLRQPGIVAGATTAPSAPTKTIWKQTVADPTPDRYYAFSSWLMNTTANASKAQI